MRRILVIAALGVALAGTQGSIASDAPRPAACDPSQMCTLDGAPCDPSACPVPCPMPCPTPCEESCEVDGAATACAAAVEQK